MAKMKIEFEGFDEAVNRLKKLDGNIRGTTEKALKETHLLVTKKAEVEIRKHKRSGRTEQSLQREADVKWNSTLATVDVGFNIQEGGLASIFLMYGTPRIKKDQRLYNAFYGSSTKKEIQELQEQIFMEEIRRLGG